MKAKLIYIFILTGLCRLSYGQTNEVTFVHSDIELSESLSTESNYISSKTITLSVGFSSEGHEFSAKVEPDLYEYDEMYTNGQSLNYIKKIIPEVEIKYLADLNFVNKTDLIEQITYTDGLGRKAQTQVSGANDLGEYMVQFYEYDEHGRMDVNYLPFTHDTEGDYLTSVKDAQLAFYSNTTDDVTDDDAPFSSVLFEDSPLSRIIKTDSHGELWQMAQGNTKDYDYSSNASTEVRKWIYNSGTGQYTASTYHGTGTLFKNTITDENNISVITYTDMDGKLILKGQEGLQTFYLYDDYGRLVHVLPPELVEQLSTLNYTIDKSNATVKKYAYTYIYGERGLLVEKYIPGMEEAIEYVYDQFNRVVLSRNGNLKDDNQWSFVKYDKYGRVAYTGLWADASQTTRSSLQSTMDNETDYYETLSGTSYTAVVYPTTNLDEHVINFYDDYIDSDFPFESKTNFESDYLQKPKGMLTRSMVKVLDGSGTYLETQNYYDKEGRLIQQHSVNVFGYIDVAWYQYNFIGQLTQQVTEHSTASNTETVTKTYNYDDLGRLLSVDQQIDGDTENGNVKMLEMEYNRLGQVKTKKLHQNGSGFLQEIDYTYNIRGWLTQINDPDAQGTGNDLFAMRFNYNNLQAGKETEMGNRTISKIEWNVFSSNPQKRAYEFTYDNHYRLTNANYLEDIDVNYYDVDYTYTSNGKIASLKRMGVVDNDESPVYGYIDDLSYTYDGNQLESVTDNILSSGVDASVDHFQDLSNTSSEYSFDKNGNMNADDNKGLNITYNHLNLPERVEYNSTNYIEFTYDAAGRKLSKHVKLESTDDLYTFVGSFTYKNNNLTKIQTEEGAVNVSGSTYRYDYFLRDHLGSVRVLFSEDSTGQAMLLEENHYYPFGMLMGGDFNRTEANTTLFSGKELNNEAYDGVKLSWYDFHARNYDPQLGTWFNVDPLAEKTMSHTPYHYVHNNPVNFVDPDGMMPQWLTDLYNGSGSGYTKWKRKDGEWGIAEREMMYNSIISRVGGRTDMMRSGEITRAIFGYSVNDIKIARSLRKYAESLSTHFTGTILIEGMDIAMNFDNGSYIVSAYDYPTTVAQGGGDYFPGMPPPDGRIDLSASKTPYSDVINFMKSLITDESKRGLIERYFAPGSGSANAGYGIVSYPMNVQGHRVVVSLTFDPEHELTGVISPKRMRNPYGQMEYGLIARGASFKDGNSTVSPWLINVHYPVGAGDLYRRTYEYLIGKRETWW